MGAWHCGHADAVTGVRKSCALLMFFLDLECLLIGFAIMCNPSLLKVAGFVKSPYAALRFIPPLDKLGAGVFPAVTVSHVMVSLSNHARALPLELFPKPAQNNGY